MNFGGIVSVIWIIFFLQTGNLEGQEKRKIQGTVIDFQNENPIAFASVSLHQVVDSTLISGTITKNDGSFSIETKNNGEYLLRISFVGYETQTQIIEDLGRSQFNLGFISLRENVISMNEAVVTAQRIKAKSNGVGTTFFMNEKIHKASNTGVDILRHLPGIQVDLMKNLSLEGSDKVLIYVDGRERDLPFVSQINADQIDKVQIIRNPGAKYAANVSGVVHISLKKKVAGVSGHVFSELPTNDKEIYLSPTGSINYTKGKFSLYGSYNGEIAYFNNTERNNKVLNSGQSSKELHSLLDVKQRNRNHHIHLGIDHYLSSKNQLSLYAYLNPHPQSFNGSINMNLKEDGLDYLEENARREEKDNYFLSNYSLYYKHLFGKAGREIDMEINHFQLIGEKSIHYKRQDHSETNEEQVFNGIKPRNRFIGFRIDFTNPIDEQWKMETGIRCHMRVMKDGHDREFKSQEDIYAGYMNVSHDAKAWSLNFGLRSEYSRIRPNNAHWDSEICFLPNAQMHFAIAEHQSLQINYRKSIYRPHIYQLIPTFTNIDPISIKGGNPNLKFSLTHNFSLQHSIELGKHHVSTQVFYTKSKDVIQEFTFVNADHLLESNYRNLSGRTQYGVKCSAALSLGKSIGFTPYLKLYKSIDEPNQQAKQYGIEKRTTHGFESGCSARVKLERKLTASCIFQYNSPTYDLQNKRYSNALYIISLDKSYNNGVKLGISSAIPFTRDFTYSGIKREGTGFNSSTRAKVHVSNLFLRFHVRYQFSKGKQRDKIKRRKQDISGVPKSGF